MDQHRTDFKTAFVALMEEREATRDTHPAAEKLVSYQRGELVAEERDQVRDHLVECRECPALIRDFGAFSTAAHQAPGAAPAELEVAAFWRALKPRLEASPPAAPAPSKRSSSWHVPMAMAASFVLTALGFSFWIAKQERILAELSQPQPNAAIYDLLEDAGERTRRSDRPIEILSTVGATLVLTPDMEGEYPGYRIEIRDSEGLLERTVEGLEKDSEDGTFTLWLPPGSLPPDEYRIELHGLESEEGESSQRIAEYRIRMVARDRR